MAFRHRIMGSAAPPRNRAMKKLKRVPALRRKRGDKLNVRSIEIAPFVPYTLEPHPAL